MNLFSLFLQGGFVMWPILLCSLIGVAVAIDRLYIVRKARKNYAPFLEEIISFIRKKDIPNAINRCESANLPVARIISKGLKKHKFGHERVKEAVEAAGRQEISSLEKGLSVLASVAGIAPLLGFLGTVTGMMQAFMAVEKLAGVVNPSDLAGGIWEALITTAFGLIVGIPILAAYNFLLGAIKHSVEEMENAVNDVLDIIQEHE